MFHPGLKRVVLVDIGSFGVGSDALRTEIGEKFFGDLAAKFGISWGKLPREAFRDQYLFPDYLQNRSAWSEALRLDDIAKASEHTFTPEISRVPSWSEIIKQLDKLGEAIFISSTMNLDDRKYYLDKLKPYGGLQKVTKQAFDLNYLSERANASLKEMLSSIRSLDVRWVDNLFARLTQSVGEIQTGVNMITPAIQDLYGDKLFAYRKF